MTSKPGASPTPASRSIGKTEESRSNTSRRPLYDALLVVSFGGPEGQDDVVPFLENVLRGKRVPRERMMEVAEHYRHFSGVSPINGQNRALIAALEPKLAERNLKLPVYWGNRNWHPMLKDTVNQMKEDGVERALALVTSAFSSYSGCRQYREDIHRARMEVGLGAPEIHKLRAFYNHPGFIDVMTDRVSEAVQQFDPSERDTVQVVFTAHSIPLAMAAGCDYEVQLHEAARLIAHNLRHPSWTLVYQSRSGPPSQPWLEPDVCDYLRTVREAGTTRNLVLVPLGFISDHMEVLFDLDTEARQLCDELGLKMIRAATAGTHSRFIEMLADLVEERLYGGTERAAIGRFPALPDICPIGCCRKRVEG